MNFSSIKLDEGLSTFSLGKRSTESFDNITFNEEPSSREILRKNDMTKKMKLPLKKCKTEQKVHKSSSKKRRLRVENKPYTFEKVKNASPSQFYNRFEQLLNFNSKMNHGLSCDIDGLERNLAKLQKMNKSKSHKELKNDLENSLYPQKRVKGNDIADFEEIAKRIYQDQQSCKRSNFSTLDTNDAISKRIDAPNFGVDCQTSMFAFDNHYTKGNVSQKVHKKKYPKRNILEEISSFDDSYIKNDDTFSDASEDEKNAETLKNMLTDMKDFITSCTVKNDSTSILDDYDNTNFTSFMPAKVYDDINDDFSMKEMNPLYAGVGQVDILEKGLGQCFDNVNFF